jgi:hypothetical protein
MTQRELDFAEQRFDGLYPAAVTLTLEELAQLEEYQSWLISQISTPASERPRFR